jgi:hypothetical protein
MNIPTRLHHSAYKIAKNSLPQVIELFKILGCEITYKPDGQSWAMMGQSGLKYDIQLVETDESPAATIETKKGTHLAFISDDPQGVIDEIRLWAEGGKIKLISGKWTEKEQYFDLPDLFINFVIEVLHLSVEE